MDVGFIMSLYAIGDLHLHFDSELKAPGQLHGRVWKDHEKKFQANCEKLLTNEDTLVLVGDHSWGKNWLSAKRICSTSAICRAGRSCCEATMICSGTPKRQPG